MKVMTVVGTRPEIIRLSETIKALDRMTDHVVVHTGQNWDPKLSDIFFEDLGLRPPDHRLDVDTSSLGAVLGGVLAGVEDVLARERPDAFLVLGDTNSAIGAIMAKRMRVPVFHMEAGNRCWDPNVPEEVNRRTVDHVADFNLCYTEHARRNLLAEGLPARRVFVTGSPMYEVLQAHRESIAASSVLADQGLERGGYFLVSMHREENVDHVPHLDRLLDALTRLAEGWSLPVLVSTHPRLRDRMVRRGIDLDALPLRFCEPFGYLDYVHLQQHARCVVSDSGTISEESAVLGFPAVTIREAMERPEALDTGSIMLTGLDVDAIDRCVRIAVAEWDEQRRPSAPPEYLVPDVSTRSARLIVSLAPLHHRWANLHDLERPPAAPPR